MNRMKGAAISRGYAVIANGATQERSAAIPSAKPYRLSEKLDPRACKPSLEQRS